MRPSPSIHLLIIDPQNDFCDLPIAWHGRQPVTGHAIAPALPVAGAHADMQRLAGWIQRHSARIGAITLTLDSHQRIDIAHPDFWHARGNAPVAPFTAITAQAVRDGDFAPRDAQQQTRVLAYLDALEAQGRYTLMVWPVHCEIGSWGHGVHADVLAACGAWQVQHQRATQAVFKGMNPWTEHYSAIEAEVPDTTDPATALNTALLLQLAQADALWIAGEASSHCVRATTEHIVRHLPRLVPSWSPQRITLLRDAMSPVAGFETAHHDFLAAMHAQGVRLASAQE